MRGQSDDPPRAEARATEKWRADQHRGHRSPSDRRRADFSAFVAGNSTTLLRTAFLLTGDLRAAEDLLQEVLERTYVAWPRVEDPHAYVRTALSRRAINRWRALSRRAESPLHGEHDVAVSDDATQVADRDAIALLLRTLPARQRATVVLRFFDDLSEADTRPLSAARWAR
jgi:DNA-directed RNA polymerase specialized sigma24 family protein